MRWVWLSIAVVSSAVGAWMFITRDASGEDVLKVANSLQGGGYAIGTSGVPEPVMHNGILVLGKSKEGTYCCGYTFWIAMKVAQQRGLLSDKEPYEIKRFQRECYGATRDSAERQMSLAMENLGIGRQVDPYDAKPGDFATFQRTPRGAGHSVIFLEYVWHNGVIVGVKYRSSQPGTDGVGEQIEYFASSGYLGATIDSRRFHVCRLSRG